MKRFGAVVLFAISLLGGCGSDSGGSGSISTPSPTPTATATPVVVAAKFTSGSQTTLVAPATVGPTGAVLTVPAGSGAMSGAKIEFPAGALDASTTVSVASDAGALSLNDGTAGAVFHLLVGTSSTTSTDFNQPIHITVPFTGDGVPVPYYIDSAGALHAAQVTAIDRTAKTVTFDTFHASIFTWIMAQIRNNDSYQTGFVQANDAFQVPNLGSLYDNSSGRPQGECFGMTTFSLWYYRSVKATEGNFYPRFMTSLGTDALGQTRNGQQVIATRTFTSVAQQWSSYNSSLITPRNNLTDEDNYGIIRNVLLNTRAPTILYLAKTTGPGAHSVLATGYNGGDLSIYDVNFPTVDRHIIYDTSTKKFTAYNGAANATSTPTLYDKIIDNGDGSFTTEPYANILADAKQNFQNSADATIRVTSHTSGQNISSRIVTLAGTIASGQVLVSKLKIIIGSTQYQADVSMNGNFSIPITLAYGPNALQIITQGKNTQSRLIDAPNNLRITGFLLNGVFTQSVILTTLTWDTSGTDLDTYVIDPTGDYSSYFHKTTADGGTLDYDVTSGYGPEHWLLTTANTVRYGQPYKIRTHYYADNGRGPSNYTVAVQLYDGPRAITTYYRGTLVTSNSSNRQATGTGADWADIVTITPVAATAAMPEGQILVAPSTDGQVHLNVAIGNPFVTQ